MKIKNTLSRWMGPVAEKRIPKKGGGETVVTAWRSIWKGENPRPVGGSPREQARNRQHILGDRVPAGALGILVNKHFVPDRLAAISECKSEENPKLITLHESPSSPKKSLIDFLLHRKAA